MNWKLIRAVSLSRDNATAATEVARVDVRLSATRLNVCNAQICVSSRVGKWTSRGYANSRSRGLVNSGTGQLANAAANSSS